MTVFISQAVGDERIGFGSPVPTLLHDRGSFRRLADRYRESFARMGKPSAEIVRPEIYQTGIARTVLGVERGDWHMAVKPVRHLRPFHGLPNAFVFDGRAQVDDLQSSGPFADPLRLLERADVVVCTTEASAAALGASGRANVFVRPPCVSVPRVLEPRQALRNDGLVHIGTWMGGQQSRDLPEIVVEAFLAARTRHEGLRLVVCLPADAPRADIVRSLAERYGGQMVSAISFTADGKDGSLGADWIDRADHVLSPDADDVFSYRLAEASMHGIPRIRTGSRETLAAAFVEAALLTPERRRMEGAKTQAAAERLYGADAFRDGIVELERRLMDRVR